MPPALLVTPAASQLTLDVLLALALAGAAALVAARFRVPALLGYVLAGIFAAGNQAIPWLPWQPLIHPEGVRALADLGVAVLMFDLGLELNLRKLQALGWPAFLGGLIQALIMTGLGLLAGSVLGYEGRSLLAIGLVVAVASTAITIQGLQRRGEMTTPHGQLAAAVLLVEDALAAFILVGLAGAQIEFTQLPGLLGTALFFTLAAILVGLFVAPRLIDQVAAAGHRDALLIVSLGLALGLGLLGAYIGASPALGAFIGGILAAETRGHLVIRSRLEPLKDVFMALFFVSVGLLVQPGVGALLPLLLVVVLLGKPLAVLVGLLVAGRQPDIALRAGLALGTVGEFNFVIATAAVAAGSATTLVPTIAILAVLTSALNPLAIRGEARIVGASRRIIPDPVRRAMRAYVAWASTAYGRRAGGAGAVAGRSLMLAAALVGGASLAGRTVTGTWAGLPAPTIVALAGLALALPLAALGGRQLLLGARTRASFGLSTIAPLVLLALALLHLTPLLAGPAPALLLFIALMLVAFGLLWRAASRDRSRLRAALHRLLPELDAATLQNLERTIGQSFPWGCHLETIPYTGPQRRLGELHVEAATGAIAVAIRHHGQATPNPSATTPIENGDAIVLAGRPEQVAQAHLAILSLESTRPAAVQRLLRTGARMVELPLPAGSPLTGQTLEESGIRARTGALVIAIGRSNELLPNPGPSFRLAERDLLVAVGPEDAIRKLEELLRRGPPPSPGPAPRA